MRTFRLVSRTVVALYGTLPLFGELRSSIAVIQHGEEFLLQRRADDLGWAFPGGMAWFWESEVQTLIREIREETALEPFEIQPWFVYHSRLYLPARISVFRAQAAGEPQGSWEGEACWRKLTPEIRSHFFPAQAEVLRRLDADSPPLSC